MLSTPPKTGNATLDAFLQEIYLKSLELEEKTIPEEGWSLTDLRSDLSEVISDKRDLIDIVTKYDDLKGYSEAISAQKEYLDSILAETRQISEHSQWFAEIMEWWDQNYKIIQDAKSAMTSATDAAAHAAAAKTSETNAKASEAAAATSATKAKTSETNAGTKATQASTSATNAKSSETAAKASETAAKASETAAAASATKTEQDVVKTAADREAAKDAATTAEGHATAAGASATAADASKVSAATSAAVAAANVAAELEELTNRAETAATTASTAVAAEVEKLKAGAPAAFDTLLEIANELRENETERSALTNSIATKADKTYVDSQLADLPTEGRSLFPDPSFEEGTDHTVVAVPDAVSGQHVSRLNAGEWTAGGLRPVFYTGGQTRTYMVTYWAKAVNFPAGYAGDASMGLRFKRFDGAQTYIGEYYPPTNAVVRMKDLTSEWVQFHAVFTVSSDHKYLAPYFVLSGVSELEGAYVDIDEVFLADVTEKEELRTHTHTSADITDAYHYIGGAAWSGKVVKTYDNGHIYVREDPPSPDAVPRRQYVDDQVAKKADTGHKHGTEDITDAVSVPALIAGRENKLVRTGGDGMLHSSSDPAVSNHLTRKGYVDAEVAKKADTGHTHTSADITDATTVGRNVLTASSQAAARSAIGAGTSSLALGTTSSTAAAGNHTHTPASIGAAPASHTHSQYATTEQVNARTPEIRMVSSKGLATAPGVLYVVREG